MYHFAVPYHLLVLFDGLQNETLQVYVHVITDG